MGVCNCVNPRPNGCAACNPGGQGNVWGERSVWDSSQQPLFPYPPYNAWKLCCVHCWCQEGKPDHVRCCKCLEDMHQRFVSKVPA